MARRFLMKQICQQSGLSLATVDRVLNERSGVRAQSRRRVAQAIEELQQQEDLLSLKGQKFMLDLVMEAPERFSRMVSDSLAAVLPSVQPAVLRVRHHTAETWQEGEFCLCLDTIARKGSDGVLLKAPKTPEIEAAALRLRQAGIPVVTLASDLAEPVRDAYVGLDNHAAGATAAYLLHSWMRDRPLTVLLSLSSHRFEGEEERVRGFCQQLQALRGDAGICRIDQGRGLGPDTVSLVREALEQSPQINAVYSVGGANRAIAQAFELCGEAPQVFIGHDLDKDNISLLKAGVLTAVIHHDLKRDLHHACEKILAAHGYRLSQPPVSQSIQIVTPYNLAG